jgi:hypothetical protein
MEDLQSTQCFAQPAEKKNTFLSEKTAPPDSSSVKETPAPVPAAAPYIPRTSQPQPPIRKTESEPVEKPAAPLAQPPPPVVRQQTIPPPVKPPVHHDDSIKKTISPTLALGPDTIWHQVITEVEHINKPILKNYMQEGIPDKWENGTLTVLFDQEFESEHVEFIKRDIHTVNNCLHMTTGIKHATVKIEKKAGVMSPHELPRQNIRDIAEVKNKVKANQYVKTVTDLFDGKIVDVRG